MAFGGRTTRLAGRLPAGEHRLSGVQRRGVQVPFGRIRVVVANPVVQLQQNVVIQVMRNASQKIPDPLERRTVPVLTKICHGVFVSAPVYPKE